MSTLGSVADPYETRRVHANRSRSPRGRNARLNAVEQAKAIGDDELVNAVRR
jgi:hypothetical protein